MIFYFLFRIFRSQASSSELRHLSSEFDHNYFSSYTMWTLFLHNHLYKNTP